MRSRPHRASPPSRVTCSPDGLTSGRHMTRKPMSSPEAMQALAHAAAAVVARDDLAGSLVRLLDDCCRLLGAGAAGLLALAPDNSLELLSATSHASAELELYQIQLSEGPCLEAIKLSRPTGAESIEEICRRWPGFGAAAAEAG